MTHITSFLKKRCVCVCVCVCVCSRGGGGGGGFNEEKGTNSKSKIPSSRHKKTKTPKLYTHLLQAQKGKYSKALLQHRRYVLHRARNRESHFRRA